MPIFSHPVQNQIDERNPFENEASNPNFHHCYKGLEMGCDSEQLDGVKLWLTRKFSCNSNKTF